MNDKEKELWKAAYALYAAGRWTTDAVNEKAQAEMWERLRDALGLPKGYATLTGVHEKYNPAG